MIQRRAVLIGLAIGLAGMAGVIGMDRVGARSIVPSVYTGLVAGVAVGGYDPVSYFAADGPMPGRADITLVHDGATWRFVSEQNRAAFRADPARYAPQYGGYCAYAVAGGGTSPADPKHWRIVDGRLYLNASKRVHLKWEQSTASYIEKGNANWPSVLGQPTQ